MGNFMSPKKEEVKEAGEVIDGPVFDLIHLPSAGGAAGAIVAVAATLLIVWFIVKKCRRHDRAARIKNLRDLRRINGGPGGADAEHLGFEMGPLSPTTASRPMMFPAPFAQGAYPSPFGNPFASPLALGYHPPSQPSFGLDYEPARRQRPKFHSSRFVEINEEEDRKRSAAAVPPPEPVDETAGAPRAKRDAAAATDRFKVSDYDWD